MKIGSPALTIEFFGTFAITGSPGTSRTFGKDKAKIRNERGQSAGRYPRVGVEFMKLGRTG
jgi:hypothetical protein